jgi:flagellar hook protein FlgE
MANSLLTGVTGLRTHQQMLDVVGNNLANVNTPGYKTQRARFSDLLYQTISEATSSLSGNVSGTNPVQVGLGTRTIAVDNLQQQGSVEATGNPLDLAIQGNGFFIANNGVEDRYTRVGAFGVDQDNFLVDPGTGFRIQRFGTVGEGSATSPAFQVEGSNHIRIPFGTGTPGRATAVVQLQGNLSSTAVGPLSETLTSAQPFTAGGSPVTSATLLNDLDDNVTDYVVGDTISIQGTDADGSLVNTSISVGPGTTMGDLISAISAAFGSATASLDTVGNIVLTADATGPALLTMTLNDGLSNVGQTSFNQHGMITTVEGKGPDTTSTGIQIFDPQGAGHTLTLVFSKMGPNTWDITASIPSADGTVIDNAVAGVLFNDDGSFRQVTGTGNGDSDVTFQFNGLSSPQTVQFYFGAPSGFDGLTQFGGGSSAAAVDQDGFGAGFLSALSVAKDGSINGIFTNGRTLPVAQLAIASFQNPEGLDREGDNYYRVSNQSGVALIGTGLTGGRGSVQQSALESSNVDIGLEFTRLIIAQRGFQVNARTITASDQVLQELASIIR